MNLRSVWPVALCLVSSPALAQKSELQVKSGESIAFLGDSITQAGARRPHGYCKLVIAGLKHHGVKAKMIPAGISGHKSNQMLARLKRDVLDKKPDWMTLSCGVNDVWHGKRGVLLPDYKKNITEIVTRAQAAGIKVMILTSTMIREDQSQKLNQQLLGYNAFLHELAKSKNCLLADLNKAMQDALVKGPGKPKGNQLTTDGVHMTTLGNIMMAQGVLKGFGMSETQLAGCKKMFDAIPGSTQVRMDLRLTAGEYRKLQAIAGKAGKSVRELLEPTLRKQIDNLLGR